jgi:hypothetical protein
MDTGLLVKLRLKKCTKLGPSYLKHLRAISYRLSHKISRSENFIKISSPADGRTDIVRTIAFQMLKIHRVRILPSFVLFKFYQSIGSAAMPEINSRNFIHIFAFFIQVFLPSNFISFI